MKYIEWWFFAKILNAFQPLNIFAKKRHRGCSTGFFEYASAHMFLENSDQCEKKNKEKTKKGLENL